MIIPDANLVLYAYDSQSALHSRAKDWLEGIFSGLEPVGLPWQTVHAFLRIATNVKLRSPLTIEQAVQIADEWVNHPNIVLLAPGTRHWAIFQEVAVGGQARGPLLTDALLAALTIEWGGVLYTTDRDFSRFPRLRWKNPLE